MKGFALVIASIALTVVCWGVYGPLLHSGTAKMEMSRLRPFFCVGIAYFVIAVVVPMVILSTRGETGAWRTGGVVWSSLAGAAGAIGALGIVLAFKYGGTPVYVMPMVFGFAPVVNALFTFATKGFNRDEQLTLGIHLAGLILIGIGAFLVLSTANKLTPHGPAHAPPSTAAPSSAAKSAATHDA